MVSFWEIQCGNCGKVAVMERGNIKTRMGCRCGGRPKGHTGLLRLFRSYRKPANARRRHITFHLTLEQFRIITSSNCHYCGRHPAEDARYVDRRIPFPHGHYPHNGIDRKNNGVGYTVANCVPCCIMCNYAKHTLSYEAFCDYIRQICDNATQGLVPCLNSPASATNSGSKPS